MLLGILIGLLCGWIAKAFGFYCLTHGAMMQMSGFDMSVSVYYFVFAILGMFSCMRR